MEKLRATFVVVVLISLMLITSLSFRWDLLSGGWIRICLSSRFCLQSKSLVTCNSVTTLVSSEVEVQFEEGYYFVWVDLDFNFYIRRSHFLLLLLLIFCYESSSLYQTQAKLVFVSFLLLILIIYSIR